MSYVKDFFFSDLLILLCQHSRQASIVNLICVKITGILFVIISYANQRVPKSGCALCREWCCLVLVQIQLFSLSSHTIEAFC